MISVKTKVCIRHVASGEERIKEGTYDFDLRVFLFAWLENNFSCDCNRGAAFARLGGEDTDSMSDDEDNDRFPCGHSAYRIPWLEYDGERHPGDADQP